MTEAEKPAVLFTIADFSVCNPYSKGALARSEVCLIEISHSSTHVKSDNYPAYFA